MGKTRGVGGIGIWKNGKILRSGLYESWEVISITQTSLSFRLTYSWTINEQKIIEIRVMSINNGNQLFTSKGHFTKNGKPLKGLKIAIGLSTQNGIAEVTLNAKEGWMSAYHPLKKESGNIGVGAIVDTNFLIKMFNQKSDIKDESHAVAVVKTDDNGVVKWQAGFACDMAKQIISKYEWNTYLVTRKLKIISFLWNRTFVFFINSFVSYT